MLLSIVLRGIWVRRGGGKRKGERKEEEGRRKPVPARERLCENVKCKHEGTYKK
jgi:hypothetical protein